MLVLMVATWAVIAGLAEFALGFRDHERAGTRALFIIEGLISVAFGVVLFARPEMGAITLALLFGLFNLMSGTWMVLEGIELRHGRTTLQSMVTKPHATAA